jgi:hypothetical protein
MLAKRHCLEYGRPKRSVKGGVELELILTMTIWTTSNCTMFRSGPCINGIEMQHDRLGLKSVGQTLSTKGTEQMHIQKRVTVAIADASRDGGDTVSLRVR